ncbi:MAG: response regulator [Holosporales bacterium]|nr:response regulator [Holosporales bacterium]
MRILIVEDERDFKILIKRYFSSYVQYKIFDLYFACNGREALEIIKNQPFFDIIVTDIQMPEMDGLTFLEKIQQKNSSTRTIVMSAYNDFHCIRRAMNCGAFDFISKPLSLKELEASLQKCIEKFFPQKILSLVPKH